MTAPAYVTAHVCVCGHFKLHHAKDGHACRDCECDEFREGTAAPLAPVAPPSEARMRAELQAKCDALAVPKKKPAKPSAEFVAFAASVRRMRRAQKKFFTENSFSSKQLAAACEREVDTELAKLTDLISTPEVGAPLLAAVPAWSEYLRRNPTAAKAEAERVAREELRLSKRAGYHPAECAERAERARGEFLRGRR